VTANLIDFGAWTLTGDFTTIDLIAASTNALNGAILARRPDPVPGGVPVRRAAFWAVLRLRLQTAGLVVRGKICGLKTPGRGAKG
jgi:hypothetical protein